MTDTEGEARKALVGLLNELETLRKGSGVTAAKISNEATPQLLSLHCVTTHARKASLTLQESAFQVLTCVAGGASLGTTYQPIVWYTFNFAHVDGDLTRRRAWLMEHYHWAERTFRDREKEAMIELRTLLRVATGSPCLESSEDELRAAWLQATREIARLDHMQRAAAKLAESLRDVLTLEAVVDAKNPDRARTERRISFAFAKLRTVLPRLWSSLFDETASDPTTLQQGLWTAILQLERMFLPELYLSGRRMGTAESRGDGPFSDSEPLSDYWREVRRDAYLWEVRKAQSADVAELACLTLAVEVSGEWARVLSRPTGHSL